MTPPDAIKKAATDAFKDNGKRGDMSVADRELAARFYEGWAGQTTGRYAELARLYNLERARFLRGEVDRIAGTARAFADEIGYPR